MEPAYGLYTHIRANRTRSIALLIGLFFLVYLLVFAGALVAEALLGDASLDWLLAAARRDFILAFPWATLGAALWIVVAYNYHQTLIDAVTGGRVDYGRAFIRYLVGIVSQLPCYLGYFWMLWDPEKQTWHDKASKTYVVPTSAYPVERWPG